MWHPLRQGSCESIIMYSELIKKRIDALATGENANTNDLGPDYWALIWEVATAMADGQVFVIPDIRETFEQSAG